MRGSMTFSAWCALRWRALSGTLILLFAMTGLATAEQMRLGLSHADPFYAADGLEGAYQDFANAPLPSGLSEDLNVTGLVLFEGRSLALARDWDWGLASMSGVLRFSLGRETVSAHLPEGFGIFTDPTHVRMEATTLGADLGVDLWQRPFGPGIARLRGWGGYSAAWVTTHVTSSLLDIQSRTHSTTPRVGLDITWTAPRLDIGLFVRGHGSRIGTVGLAMGIPF